MDCNGPDSRCSCKAYHAGKDPGGLIITILLGVAGGFLGGWIGLKLGIGTVDAFNLKSVLIATGGSIIILIIYRLLFRKKGA